MERFGKKYNDDLNVVSEIAVDNLKLLDKFKKLDVEKLIMVALGNSISTGFSFTDINKPLLDRNELLELMCDEYKIDLFKYKFARSENNSDEHVLDWILNNYTEKEMNEMNRRDYEKYLKEGKELLSQETIEKIYQDGSYSDVHIQDILFNTEEDTANIVVYNGCTGSFLDNITRGGIHKYKNGVNKDLTHIESILSMIQNGNRENNSETQVYLCGVPRLLNTGIQEHYMNRPLQTVSKRYAHTSYVDNFNRKMIYKGDTKLDLHYDKNEYLKLVHLIFSSIIKNFETKRALIGIDRELYKYNKEIEMSNSRKQTYDDVLNIVNEHIFGIEDVNELELLKTIKSYLQERYCYDFFCLDKEAIKDIPTKLLRP